MYVVTVTFELKAQMAALFLPLMLENAKTSRREEPGCRIFDVCVDPDHSQTVFLYEVYDDRKAFDAHLASDHFKSFDKATAEMVARKSVRVFNRIG